MEILKIERIKQVLKYELSCFDSDIRKNTHHVFELNNHKGNNYQYLVYISHKNKYFRSIVNYSFSNNQIVL